MTVENEPLLFSNSIADWEIPSILYIKDGGREVRLFQMHTAAVSAHVAAFPSGRAFPSQSCCYLGFTRRTALMGQGEHIAFSFLLWEVMTFLQPDAAAAPLDQEVTVGTQASSKLCLPEGLRCGSCLTCICCLNFRREGGRKALL